MKNIQVGKHTNNNRLDLISQTEINVWFTSSWIYPEIVLYVMFDVVDRYISYIHIYVILFGAQANNGYI